MFISDLIEEFADCPEISKMLQEAQEAALIDEITGELKQNYNESTENLVNLLVTCSRSKECT